MDKEQASKLELTVSIVSAYVSKNSVPMAKLAELVSSVHESLNRLEGAPAVEEELLVPAVPVRNP